MFLLFVDLHAIQFLSIQSCWHFFDQRICTFTVLSHFPTIIFYALYTAVGTRFFFRSLLPLVHYLEIVLSLHAGPQLKQILQSISAGPLFRYCYFFRSALPLVRNSATAIFTAVHCMLQFAILPFPIPHFIIPQFTFPQFAIPQYQYQPPLFNNFFFLKHFLKQAKICRTAELRKLNFGSPLTLVHYSYQSAGPLSFRQFAGQRTSGPGDQNSGLPTSDCMSIKQVYP